MSYTGPGGLDRLRRKHGILRPRPHPHYYRPLVHEPVADPGVARIWGGGGAAGDYACGDGKTILQKKVIPGALSMAAAGNIDGQMDE